MCVSQRCPSRYEEGSGGRGCFFFLEEQSKLSSCKLLCFFCKAPTPAEDGMNYSESLIQEKRAKEHNSAKSTANNSRDHSRRGSTSSRVSSTKRRHTARTRSRSLVRAVEMNLPFERRPPSDAVFDVSGSRPQTSRAYPDKTPQSQERSKQGNSIQRFPRPISAPPSPPKARAALHSNRRIMTPPSEYELDTAEEELQSFDRPTQNASEGDVSVLSRDSETLASTDRAVNYQR